MEPMLLEMVILTMVHQGLLHTMIFDIFIIYIKFHWFQIFIHEGSFCIIFRSFQSMRLGLRFHIHQVRLHLFPRRHCPGHPHRMYLIHRLIPSPHRALIFKVLSSSFLQFIPAGFQIRMNCNTSIWLNWNREPFWRQMNIFCYRLFDTNNFQFVPFDFEQALLQF